MLWESTYTTIRSLSHTVSAANALVSPLAHSHPAATTIQVVDVEARTGSEYIIRHVSLHPACHKQSEDGRASFAIVVHCPPGTIGNVLLRIITFLGYMPPPVTFIPYWPQGPHLLVHITGRRVVSLSSHNHRLHLFFNP